MNPLLEKLQPYPFERLKQLFADVPTNTHYKPISLGIGEPKHATPGFILDALSQNFKALSGYPPTIGEPALRQACANWLDRRYGVKLDPGTQILPTNGSREALFSFTQAVINPNTQSRGPNARVICPNPFYQIYEGAALLAGAQPYYVQQQSQRRASVSMCSCLFPHVGVSALQVNASTTLSDVVRVVSPTLINGDQASLQHIMFCPVMLQQSSLAILKRTQPTKRRCKVSSSISG